MKNYTNNIKYNINGVYQVPAPLHLLKTNKIQAIVKVS
jgi:hypothetical protein